MASSLNSDEVRFGKESSAKSKEVSVSVKNRLSLYNTSQRRFTKIDTCVQRFLHFFGLRDQSFACSFYISLPPALLGLCISLISRETSYLPWFRPDNDTGDLIKVESVVWQGTTFVLGFLIVFRASMAYQRYWQGMTSVHFMRAALYETAQLMCCFTTCSKAAPEEIQVFKHLLVRLFSLAHLGALMRLMEPDIDDDLARSLLTIDPTCLEPAMLDFFIKSEHRFEVVCQWIQNLIIDAENRKVIAAPPPIVSRCFQEFAQGVVQFHDALKVKVLPFPGVFQQVCDVVLIIVTCFTPVLFSLWCNSSVLTPLFTFITVFVLWSLSLVARSIEDPFASRDFIMECCEMQVGMNELLLVFIEPELAHVPCMKEMCPEDLQRNTVIQMEVQEVWKFRRTPSKTKSKLALAKSFTLSALVEKTPSGGWFRRGRTKEKTVRGPWGEDSEKEMGHERSDRSEQSTVSWSTSPRNATKDTSKQVKVTSASSKSEAMNASKPDALQAAITENVLCESVVFPQSKEANLGEPKGMNGQLVTGALAPESCGTTESHHLQQMKQSSRPPEAEMSITPLTYSAHGLQLSRV